MRKEGEAQCLTSYRQLHSLCLLYSSLTKKQQERQFVAVKESRILYNLVFSLESLSCGLIYRQFLEFLFSEETRIYYYSPANMFYWKDFLLAVHYPSKFYLCFCSHFHCVYLVYDTPAQASSTAHASDCKSVFRNSSTCHSQALALSHSHTHTHTHACVGFSFFNLGEQQLISHSCATPPLPACPPLQRRQSLEKVPCGARRRKRRVFGSTP